MENKKDKTLAPHLKELDSSIRITKNLQLLLFCAISALMTLWYCKFIFTSSSQMLGTPITDAFQSFAIISKNIQVFQTGNIPFGAFWLPDFYGGAVATYFHVSIIPEFSHTYLLALSLITDNFVLSLKVYAIFTLFAAQIFSYKLANLYFKNQAIAWILSIGYSFSTFYLSQCNDGHCNFLITAALLPGVLLLFERIFINPNVKNMFLASTSLILLFFGDLQITIFTLYYIILRIGYYLIVNKNQRTNVLKRLVQCAILFSISVTPFLISFIMFQNTSALSVTSIPANYLTAPSELFSRNVGTVNATGSTIYSLYVGLVLFGLSIIPMFLFKDQTKQDRRNYIFHVLTFVFFLLVAVGTPLSSLVTTLFIRVPSRSVILIDLSVCICAGYGLGCLNNYFNHKSHKFQSWKNNKTLKTALIVGLATVVFLDLTYGMVPITSPTPNLTGGDLFILNQAGDFRVIKYPITWAYTNYESDLIKHEIIGESVIALRSYPSSSELYSDLVNNFNGIGQSLNVDPSNFTLLATLNGAKYVLIEKNDAQATDYINFFNNATAEGYFAIACSDQDSTVYQNLYFAGTVFAVKDKGQIPALDNLTLTDFSKMTLNDAQIDVTQGFNSIGVSGNVSTSAYVVLSQSYSKYWVNSDSGDLAFVKFLNVTAFHVNQGSFKINAVFSVADQTWNLYIVFFGAIVLVGAALYASSKDKKNLLKITLCMLLMCGLVTTFLAFLGTNSESQFLRNWAVFRGVFNNVMLLFGCAVALGSLILLNWNKITTFASSILNFAKKFRRGISGDEADVKGKRLAAGILIGALVLTVIAVFLVSSTNIVFKLQHTVANGIYTENYVADGTQFSLGLSATELLLAGLIFFVAVTYLVTLRLLSELKKGIITTSLVVVVGSSISALTLLFAVFEGGLFLSLAIFDSGVFWFMLLTCSSSIMAVLLVLRDPIVLTTLSAFRRTLSSIGSIANLLLKVLLVSSLLFIVLANLPLGFSDATSWLDDNIVGILLVILFLYIVVRISARSGNLGVTRDCKFSEVLEEEKVIHENRIGHLHFGVVGGLVGIFAAGLVMRTITLCSQDVYTPAFILCGAFSGLGFGVLTRGKSRTRGIIGCVFGFIAIIFGLIMAFNAPILIGYTTNYSTGMLLPIYKWHENTFIQFAGTQLLDMNGLFFCFFGLLAAYLGGSKPSLKTIGKRRFIKSDEQNPKPRKLRPRI